MQLVELMPLYMFNAYGASTEWIARDRALLRDTVAAMIEANRAIYREKDKVVPIIVEGDAEAEGGGRVSPWRCRPRTASGRSTTASIPKRTQWSIDNSVANGDIEAAKKPTVEQVSNIKLAEEAVEARRRPRHHRQLHGVTISP